MADKTQRLNIVSPVLKHRRVYVPESSNKPGFVRDWAEIWLSQLCAFPEVRHDDLVDSTTQALRILRDMGWVNIDPIQKDDADDYVDAKHKLVNPYAV